MAKKKEELSVLETDTPRIEPYKAEDFLSTGCTLLNLAISGRPRCGMLKGTYLYFVGDSSSGKTWFSFNLFAEAARNKHFADYRFVFDNAENGALMDVERYFGKGVLNRLVPPDGTVEEPVYSNTVKDFYLNLVANIRKGPCIYVLDSMDALTDDVEEEIFEAEMDRKETGEGKVPKTMGVNKARENSRNINRVVKSLRSNGSVLGVVSQTRDKFNSHIPGQKTRAGGRALKFYAHVEAWTSVRGPMSKSLRGKDREYGSLIQIDIQKNRINGWEGKLPLIPFIKTFGVDDVGSCVDFLVDEKHWKKANKEKQAETKKRQARASDEDEDGARTIYDAAEFKFAGTKEEIIRHLEAEDNEWELQGIVAGVWREIIEAVTPARRNRYE